LLARLPQPLQPPESQPLPGLQASFPAMERQVMAIQAVEVLLVHFLGWVPLRALRRAHRGAVSFTTVLVLRQALEYFLGRRVVQFVPFHTSPSRECFGLKPSGSSVSSALGLARRPGALQHLGGQPVQDILLVRYVGAQAWHQTPSRTITPDELQGIFPHGGFNRALRWLRTQRNV